MLLSLATPYAAFLAVEHLGGSGLIAAVVCGLVEGYRSSSALEAAQRSTNRATWAEISLVLESSVFLLMGLQLPAALADEQDVPPTRTVVLALLLVVRALVVALMLAAARHRSSRHVRRRPAVERALMTVWHNQREHHASRRSRRRVVRLIRRMERTLSDIDYYAQERLGAREGATIVWAGMRGAVTVAAAQTLPSGLPGRTAMILIAFCVAAISLVLQGGTLGRFVAGVRPAAAAPVSAAERAELHRVMRAAALRVPVPEELKEALDDLRAAAAAHGGDGEGADEETELVSRAQNLLGRAGVAGRLPADRRLAELAGRHALEVIDAQRRALLAVNQTGRYSPAALTGMLRVLDADQAGLELRMRV